jgi:uncharacterized cupredoxin-like copper-binding protein
MTALAVAAPLAPVAAAQPARPTVIKIELSEYKFDPAQIQLTAGQPYVLHLTDSGNKAHDLSAPAFFQSVSLAPASASKVRHGDVDLDGGESVDVAFTPQKAGTYPIKCTHPFHSMLGMKGEIVVR